MSPDQELQAVDSARAALAAGDCTTAWRVLGEAVRSSQSARLVRQADRLYTQLRKADPDYPFQRKTRLALVGTVTLNFLVPVLRAQSYASGIDTEFFVGGFGQYQQEILDPDSDLARFRPDVVLILADWRSLGLSSETSEAPDLRAGWETLWRECRDRLQAFVIHCNFEAPARDPLGRLSAASPGGRARIVRALNLALWQAAERQSGVAILDLDQIASQFGKNRWTDPVLWHAAKQYPAADALPLLGQHITALLRAILGVSKKCLAVDLDGVLWGGVIGEDGLNGIELGGAGQGEVFAEFQRYLKSLAQRGVLLAACSKNNPEDARSPFREHPETVLREDDFAAFEANWQDKDENLRQIAATLNIGLDSIVFADDNPMERARVRQQLPMVEVLDLPADPAGYLAALDSGLWFEALAITAEDRKRGRDIRQNVERNQAASGDLDGYLVSLGMKVRLDQFDEKDLPRITQLINKTNQFNLTTRRTTEGAVRALVGRPDVYTAALRLEDRFGDSGLTGVLIALRENDTLRIETWLMSCRILGRRLDQVMLAALLQHGRETEARAIIGEYRPTAKNGQVAAIFERFGFQSAGESPDGGQFFRLNVDCATIEFPQFIEIT